MYLHDRGEDAHKSGTIVAIVICGERIGEAGVQKERSSSPHALLDCLSPCPSAECRHCLSRLQSVKSKPLQ